MERPAKYILVAFLVLWGAHAFTQCHENLKSIDRVRSVVVGQVRFGRNSSCGTTRTFAFSTSKLGVLKITPQWESHEDIDLALLQPDGSGIDFDQKDGIDKLDLGSALELWGRLGRSSRVKVGLEPGSYTIAVTSASETIDTAFSVALFPHQQVVNRNISGMVEFFETMGGQHLGQAINTDAVAIIFSTDEKKFLAGNIEWTRSPFLLIGHCVPLNSSRRVIEIRKSRRAGYLDLERTLFHELGHCFFGPGPRGGSKNRRRPCFHYDASLAGG